MKITLVAFSILCLLLSAASLRAEDRQVRTLEYQNCGAYTVSKFWVKWKENGETKSKKFNREVRGYAAGFGSFKYGACFSLDEIGVPEGAEVWLSFRIAGGDKEGCRKDNTKLYATGSKGKRQYYWSKGTTLNGNRCRLWKYVGTSASCKGTFTPDDCDSRCTSC
jgi:hypothetical protein